MRLPVKEAAIDTPPMHFIRCLSRFIPLSYTETPYTHDRPPACLCPTSKWTNTRRWPPVSKRRRRRTFRSERSELYHGSKLHTQFEPKNTTNLDLQGVSNPGPLVTPWKVLVPGSSNSATFTPCHLPVWPPVVNWIDLKANSIAHSS